MMEKGPKQKSVDIRITPFYNDDPINAQIENTDNFSFIRPQISITVCCIPSFISKLINSI